MTNQQWWRGYTRLKAAAVNALVGGATKNHKWLILAELQQIQRQFQGKVDPHSTIMLTESDFKQGSK